MAQSHFIGAVLSYIPVASRPVSQATSGYYLPMVMGDISFVVRLFVSETAERI